MNNKPLSYQEFVSIYSKVPRLNVEVVLIKDDGIVLTKRSIEPCIGQWHLPGGTIYFGESIDSAVSRVAMEEIGVEVEIVRLLGAIEYPKLHNGGYFGWPVGLAYEVKLKSGVLRGSEQGEEVSTFNKLPSNTIEDQVRFIRKHYKNLV